MWLLKTGTEAEDIEQHAFDRALVEFQICDSFQLILDAWEQVISLKCLSPRKAWVKMRWGKTAVWAIFPKEMKNSQGFCWSIEM